MVESKLNSWSSLRMQQAKMSRKLGETELNSHQTQKPELDRCSHQEKQQTYLNNMMGETELSSRDQLKPTQLDSPPLYRGLLRGMLPFQLKILMF